MATPTLVQHLSISNTGSTSQIVKQLDFYLPNPTLSGNCLCVGMIYNATYDGSNAVVPSISDDMGNTYTVPTMGTNALPMDFQNGNTGKAWYALNIAAGTRHITITFDHAITAASFTAVVASEFYNIATSSAQDGGDAGQNSGTNSYVTPAFTTAVDGDLIWCFAAETNATSPWNGASITAGSGFTGLSMDVQDGHAAQYRVQVTHGSNTPGITYSGTPAGGMIAFALKSASAGTAPGNAIRIVREVHQSLNTKSGTSFVVDFPCEGNLIATVSNIFTASATVNKITAVSDGTNTWHETVAGGIVDAATNPSCVQAWYTGNATPSNTLVLTFTSLNSSWDESEIVVYDIANALDTNTTAAFDNGVTASGNQSTTGYLTTTSITPTTSNGLVLCKGEIAIGTVFGVNGGPLKYLFGCATFPSENGGGNHLEEDNALAHCYNTDTTQLTFVFSTTQDMTGTGVGEWAAIAAAFKSKNPGTASGYTSPPASAATETINGIVGFDTYYPWICPATVPSAARFECWGAGGGGGRSTTNLRGCGSGKGGGNAFRTAAAVTPGNCYLRKIGGAGNNPAGTVFSGAAVTIIDNNGVLCIASTGVTSANNSTTGSTTSTGTTTGDTTHTGSNGGNGGASTAGAGGGGSGGDTGNGAAPSGATGGAAGTTDGGAGGNGGATGANNVGTAGATPGGGGGGAFRQSANTLGGDGGLGQIKITGALATGFPAKAWFRLAETLVTQFDE